MICLFCDIVRLPGMLGKRVSAPLPGLVVVGLPGLVVVGLPGLVVVPGFLGGVVGNE